VLIWKILRLIYKSNRYTFNIAMLMWKISSNRHMNSCVQYTLENVHLTMACFLIEVPAPSQDNELSWRCIRYIESCSKIMRIDNEIVLTVWYYLPFILFVYFSRLRWYHTLQGDNSLKSVERFDHMMFVCRFQAFRWSKPQREKLLCGLWIYKLWVCWLEFAKILIFITVDIFKHTAKKK
jgi:hypothetical protein